MPRKISETPAAEADRRTPLINLQEAIGQTLMITGAELKEMPPRQELKAILRTQLGDFVSAQRGIKQQATALAEALKEDSEPIEAFVQPIEGNTPHGNTLLRLVDPPEWTRETCRALQRLLSIADTTAKKMADENAGNWATFAATMQKQTWGNRAIPDD